MAIEFRRVRVDFGSTVGREASDVRSVVFSKDVKGRGKVDAAINGFKISFAGGNRPFKEQKVDASIESIQGDTVFVRANLLLRDSSGSIDDFYFGYVDVLVIADVVD